MHRLEGKFKGCSENNASCFILLAHNVRYGYWCCGSRGWTFPQVFHFVVVWQMAAEGWADTMASDMEVWMEQRCGNEFLHEAKNVPTDIHQCLLNAYGDWTVDVSTMRVQKMWVLWLHCWKSFELLCHHTLSKKERSWSFVNSPYLLLAVWSPSSTRGSSKTWISSCPWNSLKWRTYHSVQKLGSCLPG